LQNKEIVRLLDCGCGPPDVCEMALNTLSDTLKNAAGTGNLEVRVSFVDLNPYDRPETLGSSSSSSVGVGVGVKITQRFVQCDYSDPDLLKKIGEGKSDVISLLNCELPIGKVKGTADNIDAAAAPSSVLVVGTSRKSLTGAMVLLMLMLVSTGRWLVKKLHGSGCDGDVMAPFDLSRGGEWFYGEMVHVDLSCGSHELLETHARYVKMLQGSVYYISIGPHPDGQQPLVKGAGHIYVLHAPAPLLDAVLASTTEGEERANWTVLNEEEKRCNAAKSQAALHPVENGEPIDDLSAMALEFVRGSGNITVLGPGPARAGVRWGPKLTAGRIPWYAGVTWRPVEEGRWKEHRVGIETGKHTNSFARAVGQAAKVMARGGKEEIEIGCSVVATMVFKEETPVSFADTLPSSWQRAFIGIVLSPTSPHAPTARSRHRSPVLSGCLRRNFGTVWRGLHDEPRRHICRASVGQYGSRHVRCRQWRRERRVHRIT